MTQGLLFTFFISVRAVLIFCASFEFSSVRILAPLPSLNGNRTLRKMPNRSILAIRFGCGLPGGWNLVDGQVSPYPDGIASTPSAPTQANTENNLSLGACQSKFVQSNKDVYSKPSRVLLQIRMFIIACPLHVSLGDCMCTAFILRHACLKFRGNLFSVCIALYLPCFTSFILSPSSPSFFLRCLPPYRWGFSRDYPTDARHISSILLTSSFTLTTAQTSYHALLRVCVKQRNCRQSDSRNVRWSI